MTLITGGLIFGITNLDFTFINESAHISIRSRMILCLMLFYPSGGILFTFLFKWLANWRDALLYIIVIPSLFMNIPSFLVFKETPIWLEAMGRTEHLKEIILSIASTNNRSQFIPLDYEVKQEKKEGLEKKE